MPETFLALLIAFLLSFSIREEYKDFRLFRG
jgi:hypothetical protein